MTDSEKRPIIGTGKDSEWLQGRGSISFQIGLATFGILALELALIRWTSCQIRAFAYFNNLVLIGAFLGMGLGIAVGRRRGELMHWTLPSLLVVSIPIGLSEYLGIVRLPFPDSAVFLWGAESVSGGRWDYVLNISIFITLFFLIVAVFVFAGCAVGQLFTRLPALRAYSSDLLGSLCGVLVFTMFTFFNAGPPVWLAIGALPFLWLSRRPSNFISFAGVVVLGWLSITGAQFSPYNRIDIEPSQVSGGRFDISLNVNRDYHQLMLDLSDQVMLDTSLPRVRLENSRFLRDVYDIPFQMTAGRERALVVGAGTGNDVQAALRSGFKSVHSVDIDGRIIELGRQMHPERPYDDPRAIKVVNDARAFLQQYDGPPFDVVCYGLLDSHAMFSSMSSLRLDNFVYTEQGIRAAWEHVAEDGHLSISFSLHGGFWLMDRLYWTIFKATGQEPLAVFHNLSTGVTFLVARDMSTLATERVEHFVWLQPEMDIESVRTPSDDWPFLYVKPGTFPWIYVLVLCVVIGLATVATPLAFGRRTFSREFDTVLFFMGAAFLLIETRGVTTLSLLFGSTWLVNSSVFAGILVMVLVANVLVQRFHPQRLEPWFVLLLVSTTFLAVFDCATLNQLSLLSRGLVGGLVHAVPIGFAGVIVSILLARSASPAASLGSNLLGAVVGGCLEYLSMLVGLKSLVFIALVCYLLALLLVLRRKTPASASS